MAILEEKLVQPLNVVSSELIEKNLKLIKKLMAEGKPFKRVAVLYRVSTKKQLNLSDHGEDIPTQRNACQNFIKQKTDWYLVEEYYEKGVSGYKVRASKRDAIQRAKDDALKDKYDVLLVFMFDRLGRLDDETPFVLEWFVSQGIEMWSVKEGQQKIEGRMDKLMNYLRFWSAGNESANTSLRVREDHEQMVKRGEYRGGSVPYGYKLVPSGEYNKKKKELMRVTIDDEAAAVVRQIFDWVDLEGYGQYLIPKMLNEKGITTRKGKPWASNTISAILRNPFYMGYMSFARGTQEEIRSSVANPKLIIISEEKWNRVQAIRAGRNPEQRKKLGAEVVVKNTKGDMLLIGLVRCGHCGYTISSTPNTKTSKLKDGTEVKYRALKYRCSGKALKKAVHCEGQTTYSQKRVESVVLDEVLRYLDHLEQVDLTKKLNELKKRNTDQDVIQLQRLSKELDDAQEEMKMYKAEVKLSLKGTGKFTSELLGELIEETGQNITELEEQVEQARRKVEAKRIERKELETLQQHIPNWRKVFNQASAQQKKMMLRTIIGSIEIRRDGIKVQFKLRISQFIGTMGVEVGGLVDSDKVLE